MNPVANRFVDKVLGRMTLDEKIGQCITMVWRGSLVTPSVVEEITRLHVGGLRVEPIFTESAMRQYYKHSTKAKNFRKPKGYFKIAETYFRPHDVPLTVTATEYARRLNRLKEIAMNRPSGVPLHVTTDFEGGYSHDFSFDGINIFPANMGLRAAGGPDLAYQVGRAIGLQLSAIGINMIHSPVCDINTNPKNPEIEVRSFSDDPDVFLQYVVRFWEGLEDGGLIATGKHFPGRGASDSDAHYGLPYINLPRRRLEEVELAPYRALIAKGLKAVMTAHTVYPGLDPDGQIATLSSKILIDVLRHELGFDGVITTDAMGMGAIATTYGVPRGCAMALKAGCNLVLPKFEGELRSQVFFEIKRWADEGRLTEAELDDRVRRTLLMKHRAGLFENGGLVDPEKASPTLHREDLCTLGRDVARKAALLLRDRQKLLPLSPHKRVMVVEQVPRPELVANTLDLHSHILNEAILAHSLNVVNVATDFAASPDERRRVLAVAKEVDVVVITNYYLRSDGETQAGLVRELVRRGHTVVVVTTSPDPRGAVPEAGTVLVPFGAAPHMVRAAAEVLYGTRKAPGRWPLEHTKRPK